MTIFHCRGALAPDDPLFVGPCMRWEMKPDYAELADVSSLCRLPLDSYIIVFGARQTGKTSLIYRLQSELGERVHVVLISLQALGEADVSHVFQHIGRKLLSRPYMASDEDPMLMQDSTDFRNFLCHSRTDRPVLIALDEIGSLPPKVALALSQNLRALHQSRHEVGNEALGRYLFLLAGGIELYESASASLTSPLRNISERFYLLDLTRAQSDELLAKGLSLLGMDDDQIHIFCERIYRYAQGQPYLTQRLGLVVERALPASADTDVRDIPDSVDTDLAPTIDAGITDSTDANLAPTDDADITDSTHADLATTIDVNIIDSAAMNLATTDDAHILPIIKGLKAQGLWDVAKQLAARPGCIPFSHFDDIGEQLMLLGLIREENGRCMIRNPIYVESIRRADGGIAQSSRKRKPNRAWRVSKHPSTITWLHISDLHFRQSQMYDADIVLRALLSDIRNRIEHDGLRPDFIAITGDVAFSGLSEEYAMAQRFLDDLIQVTGLTRDYLFVVPGNHDVDRRRVSRGAQGIGDSLEDRKSTNDVLASAEDRQLMFARFHGYATFVNAYLSQHLEFNDASYFYVRMLDIAELQVALLGLNSAWLCASDNDRAKGLLIGERQTRAAVEQAEGAHLKIALLHHPFDWLRDFDRNDSAAMLLDNCDFVLHGHMHQTAMAQLIGPEGGAMLIAGGACYETREFPNMYNFVRLDFAAGTGTVYLRRYSDRRGGFWTKDVMTYRNVTEGEYSFDLPGRLLGVGSS